MEDLQPQEIQSLSVHIEGLEAALDALPSDPEMGASLRRMARSLSAAATKLGADDLARAAEIVQNVGGELLDQATRDCLLVAERVRTSGAAPAIQVLLVEDNRTIAVAVQAYLKGPGYTVHHAEDAASAERILSSEAIDLVLLDLILPDRDGRDLLVQMREDRATADVAVVVMSAKEGAVAKAECLAVGAVEFIEKPVDPKVLRATVARHARARGAANERGPEACQAPTVPGRAALVEAYEPLRLAAEDGTPASVALITVNDFATVARAIGEESADALVARLAGPIGEGLSGHQVLGRWGRAQLVALFPGAPATDAKQAIRAGMSRLAASGLLEEVVGDAAEVTFSAGVAVAEGTEDLREVVSAAEESMLKARSAGQTVVVRAEEPEPDRPRRVLLVEDDRVTSTLIHHRLEREGFEVEDFPNGEDAFEWARDGAFDLAILDVKVPGMDGFELLERLRAIERLDAVPIVMLTGLGGEADVIRGLDLGANDYMLKPFSPTELLARVRRLIYSGGAGSSEAGGPRGAPAEVTAR